MIIIINPITYKRLFQSDNVNLPSKTEFYLALKYLMTN